MICPFLRKFKSIIINSFLKNISKNIDHLSKLLNVLIEPSKEVIEQPSVLALTMGPYHLLLYL
jgi:hypothetical protein